MPKKIYTGTVVSDAMDKTVVVAVTRTYQHRLYKKIIRRVTKFKAHDEGNRCTKGDIVQIVESRPFSKDKRWQVLSIVKGGEA